MISKDGEENGNTEGMGNEWVGIDRGWEWGDIGIQRPGWGASDMRLKVSSWGVAQWDCLGRSFNENVEE